MGQFFLYHLLLGILNYLLVRHGSLERPISRIPEYNFFQGNEIYFYYLKHLIIRREDSVGSLFSFISLARITTTQIHIRPISIYLKKKLRKCCWNFQILNTYIFSQGGNFSFQNIIFSWEVKYTFIFNFFSQGGPDSVGSRVALFEKHLALRVEVGEGGSTFWFRQVGNLIFQDFKSRVP